MKPTVFIFILLINYKIKENDQSHLRDEVDLLTDLRLGVDHLDVDLHEGEKQVPLLKMSVPKTPNSPKDA